MPALKRTKTKFKGVHYLVGKKDKNGEYDKIFYIRYRLNGKLIEKRVGSQIKNGMSAEEASKIRLEKIGSDHHPKKKTILKRKSENTLSHIDLESKWTWLQDLIDWNCLQDEEHLIKIISVLFRYSKDGLIVTDNQGKVIACNEACSQLSGIELNDILGKTGQEIANSGEIDKSVSIEVLKMKKQVTRVTHMRRTGKALLITGTPVIEKKGSIKYVVVNERDITELNRLKEEHLHMIQIANKYKEKFSEVTTLKLLKNRIVANSQAMRQVISICYKLSNLTYPQILIMAESGTGKGVMARLIHEKTKRKNNPFIHINCASVPETLLEAELFGYEKGAFTGASEKGKVGLFELANGGTLFLDEIGDTPKSIQTKLLTYLDNRVITRVGGINPIKIDCAIIAATNRNLKSLVSEGKFREDLFYRLDIFGFTIPPLRERPDDIAPLAYFYLNKYNKKYNFSKKITSKGIKVLESYSYPGNVRELKNKIQKLVAMSEQSVLDDDIINEFC